MVAISVNQEFRLKNSNLFFIFNVYFKTSEIVKEYNLYGLEGH